MSRRFEAIVKALDDGRWLKADPTGRTEVRARCPAHNGRDENLAVFTGTDGQAAVKCHSQDCSTESILRALGLWRERVPAPPGTVRYEARTAADPTQVVSYHVVTNKPGRSKSVRWDPAGITTPDLALYRSWDLQPADTTVVICEGERATDAVIAAGIAAVGTQTGAAGQPGDAALAILQGRDVVLWPDADGVGRTHMNGIARRLDPCRIVDLSDAPEKWDAADATPDDIRRSVASAQPYDPAQPAKASARVSAATLMVNMAHARGVELFRDPVGVAYLADGRVVMAFPGGDVASWLRRLMWEAEDRTVSSDAITEASSTLEAEALYGAVVEEVFLRVGQMAEGIALDLGTPDWTAVVIRPSGWSIEPHPVRFRRPKTMGALPMPVAGGNLMDLRQLMNLGDDEQTRFMLGFLIGCLNPSGPFASLSLTGEQGSAKSFTAGLARRLIDPVADGKGLKTLTKSDEAFWGYAYHSWVPTFDNISGISAEQSDRLAQLATGSGRTARKLFSDGEEYTQSACRPAIINGIEVAERSDLLSRTIPLTLPRIESGWTVERHLNVEFDAKHPGLLGALCAVMVGVVGRIDSLPMDGWKARMADHVRWVTAAEPALGWADRSYEAQFVAAQDALMSAAAEGIAWLPDLHTLLGSHSGRWSGGAGELRNELTTSATYGSATSKLPDGGIGWPKTGKGMTDALKRHATSLRSAGIVHRTELDVHTKQYVHHLSYDPSHSNPWLAVVAGVAGVAGVNSPSVTDGGEEKRQPDAGAQAPSSTSPLVHPDHRESTPATPATPAAPKVAIESVAPRRQTRRRSPRDRDDLADGFREVTLNHLS